jgi:site-specific recombinase XerD
LLDATTENSDAAGPLFLTLLYGTGSRLIEGLRLRVKDIDFAGSQIPVRDGKGEKDRVTMQATRVPAAKSHINRVLVHACYAVGS